MVWINSTIAQIGAHEVTVVTVVVVEVRCCVGVCSPTIYLPPATNRTSRKPNLNMLSSVVLNRNRTWAGATIGRLCDHEADHNKTRIKPWTGSWILSTGSVQRVNKLRHMIPSSSSPRLSSYVSQLIAANVLARVFWLANTAGKSISSRWTCRTHRLSPQGPVRCHLSELHNG